MSEWNTDLNIHDADELPVKTKTTIRTPKGKDRPYFSTARKTAQDSRLSFEARGVLWYLLSKPDDWKVVIGDLMREGEIGRDKAKGIVKELRDCGYIHTEMTHDSKGRFTGKTDRIYEVPTLDRDTENPSDGKTVERENQSPENPKIHNTDSLPIEESDSPPSGDADASPSEKPKTPRKRNPMTDAVTIHFFETALGTNPETEKLAAFAGNWLAGKSTGTRNIKLEKLLTPLTPDDVPCVVAYFKVRNPDAATPHDLRKIAKWTYEWINAGRPATPQLNGANPLAGRTEITG